MLAADNLGVRFGSRWVFRRLSFQLEPGDGLLVSGSNGSGKSTLLRALAGLATPTEGSVRMPEGDPRRTLAVSAIDQQLYAALSVREHLELAGAMRGVDPRADELIERVGLTSAADRWASRLSTGMRARLRLALAIQTRPLVLLLDEPGAGLDEAGTELVESVCAEQRERGVLVVATNDPRERRLGNLEIRLG